MVMAFGGLKAPLKTPLNEIRYVVVLGIPETMECRLSAFGWCIDAGVSGRSAPFGVRFSVEPARGLKGFEEGETRLAH